MRFMPHVRASSLIGLACLLLVCLLCGCAGKKPAVDGAPVEVPVEVATDSLRAKMAMTLVDAGGKTQNLDAVLFSVPGKRYRMEMTGPMGIGVASMLWKEEGWTMVFPTEKLYMEGRGYMVGLFGEPSIPMVNIHQVAGFFDGDYVPSGVKVEQERDSLGMKIVDAVDQFGTHLSYALAEGQVQWISRTGRDDKPEVLRFMGYRQFEGKTLAEKIVFERDGNMFLEMRLKKVTHGKPFSPGTWRLNVPKSYKPVGR